MDRVVGFLKTTEGSAVSLALILIALAIRYLILSYGFYYLLYRIAPAWLTRRLVLGQPHRHDITHDLRKSLVIVGVYSIVAWLTLQLIVHGYTQVYFTPSEYGWVYLIMSVPLMMMVHDTYFFWMHYVLHTRWLYRRVHSVHHQSRNPTPMSAQCFHPVEGVVEAGVYPLAAIALPMNIYALLVFYLIVFVIASYGHSGLELSNRRWAGSRWTNWMATATFHTMHHRTVKYHFGLYFTVWDRLLGTVAPDYLTWVRPAAATVPIQATDMGGRSVQPNEIAQSGQGVIGLETTDTQRPRQSEDAPHRERPGV